MCLGMTLEVLPQRQPSCWWTTFVQRPVVGFGRVFEQTMTTSFLVAPSNHQKQSTLKRRRRVLAPQSAQRAHLVSSPPASSASSRAQRRVSTFARQWLLACQSIPLQIARLFVCEVASVGARLGCLTFTKSSKFYSNLFRQQLHQKVIVNLRVCLLHLQLEVITKTA